MQSCTDYALLHREVKCLVFTPHVPLNKHEVLSNLSISNHLPYYDCCEKLTSNIMIFE